MRTLQKITTIIIVVILIVSGCNRHNIPRGFPKPEKMAEILADIHIAESTITNAPTQSSMGGNRNIPGHYKYVLQKHNLTPEQFDTIRKWYVSHPQLYQQVYGRVLTKLSEHEADIRIRIERMRQEEQELAELQRELEQQRNLWRDTVHIKITPEDTVLKNAPFRIDTDTVELSGTLKLSAFYRFFKEDVSRSPRMMLSAFYPDSIADTVYADIHHSFQSKWMELELTLREKQTPVEVYGSLLAQDSLLNISVEITDIKLQHFPPGDTLLPTLSPQRPRDAENVERLLR